MATLADALALVEVTPGQAAHFLQEFAVRYGDSELSQAFWAAAAKVVEPAPDPPTRTATTTSSTRQ